MSFGLLSPSRSLELIGTTIISALIVVAMPWSMQAQSTAKQGEITLKSDVQESNSQTGIITAKGNVKINYPARQIQATAAQAQYYSRERRLILTGDVYVIQEGNSMRAETLTYLIDEERFIATPQSDRQVESTYIITNPE
ncbi:OstA family protein [Waterburya agarophytonicola K14]|uniref:OstA family protein n=1 Tax=Waterburya agarophytonicola KI4 TaxID=2874699 RepID=A0A964FIU7_9CYAN|nr:OstA family protein [Waterburya agarophytonicola KI4]